MNYTIRNAQHLADWYGRHVTLRRNTPIEQLFAEKAEMYRRLVEKLTGQPRDEESEP